MFKQVLSLVQGSRNGWMLFSAGLRATCTASRRPSEDTPGTLTRASLSLLEGADWTIASWTNAFYASHKCMIYRPKGAGVT
jgi:hypothetical protein